jgi:hypothetical protein
MTTYHVEGSPEEIWLCDGDFVVTTFCKENYIWAQYNGDSGPSVRRHISLKYLVERVISQQDHSPLIAQHKIFIRADLVPFYN